MQRTENCKAYSRSNIGSPSFERSRQIKSSIVTQAFQPARLKGINILPQHMTEDALHEPNE